MNIGIDIDGVLFPWTDVANEALMGEFGIVDPGPHLSWTHLKDNVLTPEQWRWLWGAQGQEAVFSQVDRIYPQVTEIFTEVLRDPSRNCHFVTHRDPRRTALHTAAFLGQHFGRHPWAGLHVIQNACPKHELLTWDVFVDDKPETVYAMLEHTDAQVFTPVRPWNTELQAVSDHEPRLIRYLHPDRIARWLRTRS